MKRRPPTAGFTIVETMIVLAVTAALFLAVATTIAGRENSNQFTDAINDIRAQMQQTIGDVQSGYYPNLGNFSCIGNPGGIDIVGGTSEQGTNGACVFLGKVMQFGLDNGSLQNYEIYSVAGAREATTLSGANPTVVAPSTAKPGTPDNGVVQTLHYGLRAVKAAYGTANVPVGAVAFLTDVSAGDASAAYQGGSAGINVYGLQDTVLTKNKLQAAELINQAMRVPAKAVKNPAGGVKICFQSGGTQQYGLITIGGDNNGKLSVSLKIMGMNPVNCGLGG